MGTRRLGRFSIPSYLITDDPDAVRAMLAGCIVVRAEEVWHEDAIQYVGLSDAFEDVELGMEPPVYDALFHADREGARQFQKWVRRG